MTEKEQIEEMVAVMAASNDPFVDVPIEIMPQVAKALYNADYRKIPENAVVLTNEEYKAHKKLAEAVYEGGAFDHYDNVIKSANILFKEQKNLIEDTRKETAKEIFTEIKSLIDNAKEKLPTFFPKNSKYKQGYESSVKHFEKHILELAERMGVEVEER